MLPESDAWAEARAYRDEHDRLRQATEHVARAVAELTHAAGLIGDHASAVALREQWEMLQLLQAQLASASEKAFSLGQIAVRRAQHADLQRRATEAVADDEPPD